MKPYLLDVNVLLALAWPSHVHHEVAQRWFTKRGAAGFRTCPLTQLGFVRVSSNPKFTPNAVEPSEALELLHLITSMRGHKFWPDDLSLRDVKAERIIGHRQVTDAYLLALAARHGGVLATLDRGLRSLSLSAGEMVELLDGR